MYKGQISYLSGDYKTAVTDLTKAKEDGQQKASYYLGLTYEAQGDTDKAQSYIKEYLDSGVALRMNYMILEAPSWMMGITRKH